MTRRRTELGESGNPAAPGAPAPRKRFRLNLWPIVFTFLAISVIVGSLFPNGIPQGGLW